MFHTPSSHSTGITIRTVSLALALAGAIAAATYFSTVGNAQALPPSTLDHFKCYRMESKDTFRNLVIFLQDQFDIAAERYEAAHVRKDPRLFCNPTAKQHDDSLTEIRIPDNHLMFYYFKDIFRKRDTVEVRRVLVENQFGTQTLLVSNPKFIAVPTHKLSVDGNPTELSPPSNIDHFKCYTATGSTLQTKIGTQDQFDPAFVESKLYVAKLFCNPVRKIHHNFTHNEVVSVQNAEDHLTCYNMAQKSRQEHKVVASNQFDSTIELDLKRAQLLCVPSKKLNWELLPNTTPTDLRTSDDI